MTAAIEGERAKLTNPLSSTLTILAPKVRPERPYSKEGMLILSSKDALQATRAESKEGVLQSIGLRLRKNFNEAKNDQNKSENKKTPNSRQKFSQRKSFKNKSKSSNRRSKFGR